jgi:hypothetical protein
MQPGCWFFAEDWDVEWDVTTPPSQHQPGQLQTRCCLATGQVCNPHRWARAAQAACRLIGHICGHARDEGPNFILQNSYTNFNHCHNKQEKHSSTGCHSTTQLRHFTVSFAPVPDKYAACMHCPNALNCHGVVPTVQAMLHPGIYMGLSLGHTRCFRYMYTGTCAQSHRQQAAVVKTSTCNEYKTHTECHRHQQPRHAVQPAITSAKLDKATATYTSAIAFSNCLQLLKCRYHSPSGDGWKRAK